MTAIQKIATNEPAAQFGDTGRSSVELLESLRRISLAVASNLGLDTVLQAIVDAVCDHSQWQICWINEVHLTQNFAEVVARRDKLEYTVESRRRKWDLHKIPTLDAIRRNEPIAIPDIKSCTDYPDYCEDALLRGSVAGVIIPFNTADPQDVPRVLCVQSTLPLLDDPRQLPFLRTVTGMASLAVNNARESDSKRIATLQSAESIALFSFVAESLAQGIDLVELCVQLERRSGSSLVLFDSGGAIIYAGRSPIEYELSDEAWQHEVRTRAARLAELAHEHAEGLPPTMIVDADSYLPLPHSHTMAVSRLPGAPSLGCLLSVSRVDKGELVHSVLAAGVATIVLRDEVRAKAEREFNGNTLAALFSPRSDNDPAVIRRAAALGVDVTTPLALVVIRISGIRKAGSTIRPGLALSSTIQRWPGGSVHAMDSDLVVFLPAEGATEAELQSRVERIYESVRRTTQVSDLYIAWSGPCEQRTDYPSAWNDCLVTLKLARTLDRHDPVNLSGFGSYRFLISALASQDIDNYIQSALGPIIDYDVHQKAELLETLEEFLRSGCRLQESARRLHIHVSTLRYRLDRVKSLSNHDLSQDDTRFEVSLALRLHRLRSAPPATDQ